MLLSLQLLQQSIPNQFSCQFVAGFIPMTLVCCIAEAMQMNLIPRGKFEKSMGIKNFNGK